VALLKNFIVGACETDYHFKNVNVGRDFAPDIVKDIKNVKSGDLCPKCGKPLGMARGVEVGHIFKLGTKYSDSLGCIYLDKEGKEQSMVMGCYGIGVSRTIAAIIEQYNDEDGIKWPAIAAPYKVIVIPTNTKDETVMGVAEKLYNSYIDAGYETLIDDRHERPGVKFKDADLLGIPLRVTVGRRAGEGIVELKFRMDGAMSEATVEEALEAASKIK
ncbi:MAG: proline--tRNA ligase, partial [Clostridiales bacterium]|nr:proline--tRNA ligase [Clostridiales bacterium]